MAHHFYMMHVKIAVSPATLTSFIHKRAAPTIAQKHGMFFRSGKPPAARAGFVPQGLLWA
jgi:hypothetical protein